MPKTKELAAGDPCPTCGGDLRVDHLQAPDALIDRKTRNALNANAAARFEKHVREKADESGVIHVCNSCGYRARLQAKGKGKAA